MTDPLERRKEPRRPITQPVQLWHKGLAKSITAVGRDISDSGASLRLPLSVPLTPGQELQLRFAPPAKPQHARSAATDQPRRARVRRVCRIQTVLNGEQIVGLEMLHP